MNRKRVGILIFPDVEVLDFCGPFEVFSVTRLNEELRREDVSPFEVLVVAEQGGDGGDHRRPEGDARITRSTPARRSTSWWCRAGGGRGPR